ncbi:MAG: radical SAM protein [Candidatus Moraniibacteriota bacterium]
MSMLEQSNFKNKNGPVRESRKRMKVLGHHGVVGAEVRPLYFFKGLGKKVVDARIVSFGACNFACPYCKRDGAFRAPDGSIVSAIDCTIEDLLKVCDDAIAKGQVVRLSGGDPVVFPEASVAIGEYVRKKSGRLSIAHNGSSPQFIKRMIDLGLESAAIDLKGTKSDLGHRAGLKNGLGAKMYERSVETQDILSSSGVFVDVRTPIFSNTTLDDLLEMATDIVSGGSGEREFWTLRLYKPVAGCDWDAPRNTESVIWMIEEVKKAYPSLKMGLRAKWEPEGFLYF